jgi:hypothetical protein
MLRIFILAREYKSCLTGLDLSVLQIKTKTVSSRTGDSKPVKQEVNGTVIPPPLVFPVLAYLFWVEPQFVLHLARFGQDEILSMTNQGIIKEKVSLYC